MIMSNDDEFKNSLTGNSAAISRFLRKTLVKTEAEFECET